MMENEMIVGTLPNMGGTYKLTHRYNPVNKNGYGKRFLYSGPVYNNGIWIANYQVIVEAKKPINAYYAACTQAKLDFMHDINNSTITLDINCLQVIGKTYLPLRPDNEGKFPKYANQRGIIFSCKL